MGKPEERVSYLSMSNIEKDSKSHYIDDYHPSGSMSMRQEYPYHYPHDEQFVGDGYDSGEDHSNFTHQNIPPAVNLKNVLTGLVSIVTGCNKDDTRGQRSSSSDVSFLGSAKDGETYLHSSVCIPSAPPLFYSNPFNAFNHSAYKEVLEAEPPEWLSDSSSTGCMQCTAPFTAITRGRHHCRFCGGIFCRACSKGRCLMPVKFRERNPQRVCDACYDRLDPLQGVLINTISNAVQAAKHDVTDWTCTRGWLNLPMGFSMEHEIYKACNTLRNYNQVNRLNPEKSIPSAVLKGAKGLAILTVAKAGVLLAYKMGSGLVVARRSDGTWSPPSAIVSAGLGWGAQVGGELLDFIIVLHDSKAVKTFCSRMHFSIGAGCSAAAGPVGRVLEADLRAGDRGSGMCYTYSCSKVSESVDMIRVIFCCIVCSPYNPAFCHPCVKRKGAFVGVSLESSVVATRMDTNLQFYGDPYITTTDILLGTVDRPKAAEPLYFALRDLYSKL